MVLEEPPPEVHPRVGPHPADALALGYRRCGGTPEGAVASFRWGLCRVPAGAHGYGPADVMRFAARVAARVAQ